MPSPGRLAGSTPLLWGGGAVLPRRAGGSKPGLAGEGQIRALTIPAAPGGGDGTTYQIFGKDYLFADGQCLLELGTAGLLPANWGTVLNTDEDDGVDIQVEENDWGKVMAVGGVARRGDVTIRCRLTRAVVVPKPGDRYQFREKWWIVIRVKRLSATRAVREIAVTGARWDDLGSAVQSHPGTIQAWTG